MSLRENLVFENCLLVTKNYVLSVIIWFHSNRFGQDIRSYYGMSVPGQACSLGISQCFAPSYICVRSEEPIRDQSFPANQSNGLFLSASLLIGLRIFAFFEEG